MASGRQKGKPVKLLLRSVLRAWYELTKEDTGVRFLSAVAGGQRPKKTQNAQGMLTSYMYEVVFLCWKSMALDPSIRKQRLLDKRNSPDVKRAKKPTVGRRIAEPSKEGLVVGGVSASSRPTRSKIPLVRSRYLRVHTTPPGSMRHGRSPTLPPAPSESTPRLAHPPSRANPAAGNRSTRSQRRIRASRPKSADNDDSFSTTSVLAGPWGENEEPLSPSGIEGPRLSQSDGERRTRMMMMKMRRRRKWDGGEYYWYHPAGRGGRLGGGREEAVHSPRLWVDDMEPGEQRKTRLGDVRGRVDTGLDRSERVARTGSSAISAEMLQHVKVRLERHTHLENRQKEALALCMEAGLLAGGSSNSNSSGSGSGSQAAILRDGNPRVAFGRYRSAGSNIDETLAVRKKSAYTIRNSSSSGDRKSRRGTGKEGEAVLIDGLRAATSSSTTKVVGRASEREDRWL